MQDGMGICAAPVTWRVQISETPQNHSRNYGCSFLERIRLVAEEDSICVFGRPWGYTRELRGPYQTVGSSRTRSSPVILPHSPYRFCAIILFNDLCSVDLYSPTAASAILGITYGYTPRDVNDKFIQLAREATLESFRHGGPGSSICDLVPLCRHSLFFRA